MKCGSLPDEMKPLFHNYRPEAIDLERDADLVVSTVLLYGEWEHIVWLFRTYGWDRIEEWVARDIAGLRTLPYAVANFWSVVFWGKKLPLLSLKERWAITRFPPQGRR